jgi:hypothetical protein
MSENETQQGTTPVVDITPPEADINTSELPEKDGSDLMAPFISHMIPDPGSAVLTEEAMTVLSKGKAVTEAEMASIMQEAESAESFDLTDGKMTTNAADLASSMQDGSPTHRRRIVLRGIDAITQVPIGAEIVRVYEIPDRLRVAAITSDLATAETVTALRSKLLDAGGKEAVIIALGKDDRFELFEEVPAGELSPDEAREIVASLEGFKMEPSGIDKLRALARR